MIQSLANAAALVSGFSLAATAALDALEDITGMQALGIFSVLMAMALTVAAGYFASRLLGRLLHKMTRAKRNA